VEINKRQSAVRPYDINAELRTAITNALTF